MRDLRGQGELIQHYGVLFNLVEGLYHYMLNYPLADIERAGLDVGPSQQIGRPPRLPAERFMAEWQAGALEVPLQACTGAQLYRAFLRRWIEQGGGRSPPSQPSFTKTALRWIDAQLHPAVKYKIVALCDMDGRRRSTRCWMPTAAEGEPGATEGEWMADQVDLFEAALGRYLAAKAPK